MTGYLLRRSGVSIVVLTGITMVTYFLLHEIYPSPGRSFSESGRHGPEWQPGTGNTDSPAWCQFNIGTTCPP